MGIILYSPEVLNEKFLIKIRDCVLKLPEKHPVKRWLQWVAKVKRPTEAEQQKMILLSEILNSQFNLITDVKLKNQIIELLSDIPENGIEELVLKSYLFLMIGNITKSDNLLLSIINKTPVENWKKFGPSTNIYQKVFRENIEQIFTKLSKHPTNRKVYELFRLYLLNFSNDKILLNLLSEKETSALDGSLDLRVTEELSPSFVHYLRFINMNEEMRIKNMRDMNQVTLDEQAYWLWPFLDIDPLVSDGLVKELKNLEVKDKLWFIYLMHNEKLNDAYIKNTGNSFLPGKRQFLREKLKDRTTFMLSLFKLLEFGDIDSALVQDTINYLTHE